MINRYEDLPSDFPIEAARGLNSESGLPQSRLRFKAGRFYQTPKERAERLSRNSLSSAARRVYACIELATMAYGQEEAVITEAGNKRRPLTPRDIVRRTRLDPAHVRRAMSELEEQGLAERRSLDDGPLRKGKVVIFSAGIPPAAPIGAKKEESELAQAELITETLRFPPSWQPIVAFAARIKMAILPPDTAAARDLQNAEMRVRAVLEQVRTTRVSSSHIRKKHSETNTYINDGPAGSSLASGTPPPALPLVVSDQEDARRVSTSLSQAGPVDLAAARSLLDRCRKQAPDATVEAICAFIDLKLRIPLKANAVPEGSRTGFRDDSEHRSERSDAGFPIVQ